MSYDSFLSKSDTTKLINEDEIQERVMTTYD